MEGAAPDRSAKAGGARIIASETDKGHRLQSICPPGVPEFGVIEVNVHESQGLGITRPYAEYCRSRVILARLLYDMCIFAFFMEGILKHPLGLWK